MSEWLMFLAIFFLCLVLVLLRREARQRKERRQLIARATGDDLCS